MLSCQRAQREGVQTWAAQEQVSAMTATSRSNSPPTAATPLIGRDHDVPVLLRLLRRGSVRLLTLYGPAGVGKTRLALDVVAAVRASFAGGVVVVDLSAVRDSTLVLSTIAQAVGLREVGGGLLQERLIAWL